jgi:hypothetical protein
MSKPVVCWMADGTQTAYTRPLKLKKTLRLKMLLKRTQLSHCKTTSVCITSLAGMTGTAETEAGEFWDIYKVGCGDNPYQQTSNPERF